MIKKNGSAPQPTPPAKKPGFFLSKVTYKQDDRCFKQGDAIPFKPGVNILVGDQGSGKSTILQAIQNLTKKDNRSEDTIEITAVGQAKMFAIDLEMDLSRGKGHFLEGIDMRFQAAQLFSSHGETVCAFVMGIDQMEGVFVLMDEPDMALSPRSAYELARKLKIAEANGCQIIASVHNPLVMQAFAEVYSLEHRKYMTPDEFLESHKTPRPEPPEQDTVPAAAKVARPPSRRRKSFKD